MKRVLIGALTAVALSVSPFPLTATVAAGDQSTEADDQSIPALGSL